jgi:hypothetical protein
VTYLSEHMTLQPKKKLFVEKAVWECIGEMAAHGFEKDGLSAFEDEEDFVARSLQALEHLGYAVSDKDKDGNLTFQSTPKLLSETGKSPGLFSGALPAVSTLTDNFRNNLSLTDKPTQPSQLETNRSSYVFRA